MKFSLWIGLLMLVLVVALTGCGGGGSHSAALSAEGRPSLTIKWPSDPAPVASPSNKSKLIPAASNSIVVTISNGGTTLQSFTFVRPAPSPASYPAQTHQFNNLPVETLQVTATAYPTNDGHGVAQASVSQPLALTAQNAAPSITLTLLSAIKSLVLQPAGPLTLFAGQAQRLFAVPLDATGATVLTTGNTVVWRSSDAAGQFLTVDAVGNVAAKKATPGASPVTVTVAYTDQDVPTPLTASTAITINPAPTGGPPNVAAYINSNGLAIGPSGSGPGKFQQIADVALGSLYTADPINRGFEVQKFIQNPSNGSLTLDTSFNPGSPATAGTRNVPGATSVAVDSRDDSVYVVGNTGQGTPGAVFKFSNTGVPLPTANTPYLPTALFIQATDLAVDFQGNIVVAEQVVSTPSTTQVQVYSSAGGLLTTINTPALQAGPPSGVTVDLSDNIYVLVSNALVKLKPNTSGNPASGYTQDAGFGTGGVTNRLASAADVAVDTRPGLVTIGNLYVTVPTSNVIEVFDRNGNDSGSLPITQSPNVNLGQPSGITIDNRVNAPTSGYIYVGNTAPAGNVSQAVQVLVPG